LSEQEQHLTVKSGSEKSFGIVFAIVFLLIGIYPLINGSEIRLWSLIIAPIFFMLAYVAPQYLSVPNKLWIKLGFLLGAVISPIVMALVYFSTVVPTGLFMKLLGKNLLNKKIDSSAKTYWIERDQPVGSMKHQF
jgi:hypothetical protein